MRMHQVEVDDEVFSLVKANAEPLVDDFNSAIRRLLPLGRSDGRINGAAKPNARPTDDGTLTPSLPKGTPQALRQILEVTRLVCGGAYTRSSATRFVANQQGKAPQTVHDKYCRQLQLTASQFDHLLEQEDLANLRRLLKAKFPAHTEIIESELKVRG